MYWKSLILLTMAFTILCPSTIGILQQTVNEPLYGGGGVGIKVIERYGPPDEPQFREFPNVTVKAWTSTHRIWTRIWFPIVKRCITQTSRLPDHIQQKILDSTKYVVETS